MSSECGKPAGIEGTKIAEKVLVGIMEEKDRERTEEE